MCVNSANFAFLLKLFVVPIKKLRHTIQITNDRPIHRLNHQWQASIHFNCSVAGQYDFIFCRIMRYTWMRYMRWFGFSVSTTSPV